MPFFLVAIQPDGEPRFVSATLFGSRDDALAELSSLTAANDFGYWDSDVVLVDVDRATPVVLVRPAVDEGSAGDEAVSANEQVSETAVDPAWADAVAATALRDGVGVTDALVGAASELEALQIAENGVADAVEIVESIDEGPVEDEALDDLLAGLDNPDVEVPVTADDTHGVIEEIPAAETEVVEETPPAEVEAQADESETEQVAEEAPAEESETEQVAQEAPAEVAQEADAAEVAEADDVEAVEVIEADEPEAPATPIEVVPVEVESVENEGETLPEVPAAAETQPEDLSVQKDVQAEEPEQQEPVPDSEDVLADTSALETVLPVWPWSEIGSSEDSDSLETPDLAGAAADSESGDLVVPAVVDIDTAGPETEPSEELADEESEGSDFVELDTELDSAAPAPQGVSEQTDAEDDVPVAEAEPTPVEAAEVPAPVEEPASAASEESATDAEPEREIPTGYQASGEAVVDMTCDDCVYVETCPNQEEREPASCGSFQWK